MTFENKPANAFLRLVAAGLGVAFLWGAAFVWRHELDCHLVWNHSTKAMIAMLVGGVLFGIVAATGRWPFK